MHEAEHFRKVFEYRIRADAFGFWHSPADREDSTINFLCLGILSPGPRDARQIDETRDQCFMRIAEGALEDRQRLTGSRLRIGIVLLIAVDLGKTVQAFGETNILFAELSSLIDCRKK